MSQLQKPKSNHRGIKLGIGYSFFDCAKEIPRSLDPIAPQVYKIYGINGRYSLFDADHDFSIDGSRELVSKYSNADVIDYSGDQVDKRQKYFDMAGADRCDFLLVLDSDEYLHPDYQDWDLFYKNLEYYSQKYPLQDHFAIKIFMSRDWEKAHNAIRRNYFRSYVRLHRNPANIRYALNTHYWFTKREYTEEEVAKDYDKIVWSSNRVIDGIRLTIDSKLRTKPFLKSRDKWALQVMEDEEKYRYFAYVKYVNQKVLKKYPHLGLDPMMARIKA